jgi:ribose transport system ATP-binding protein
VEARMHIWSLMNRLLDKGCAVLVLAVNLADSLSMADRLIRVRDGVTEADLPRERFGELPMNTPWHDLWQRAPEG